MPKDAKKNVDRYKIRGGDLNEFEFAQNQGRVKETTTGGEGARGKKSLIPSKGATPNTPAAKKPEAKNLAPKKSSKKAAQKSAAKKSAAKKSAAKKK